MTDFMQGVSNQLHVKNLTTAVLETIYQILEDFSKETQGKA